MFADGTARDNCWVEETAWQLVSETCTAGNCPKVYTRTYSIEDLCGNSATCTQEITVNDLELPVITCPGPLTAVCDITEQPAYTTYAEFTLAGGTASDNCGIDETTFQLVSETSTAGNCPKVYTRTYSIEDLCGNSATCTQEITVNDLELPVITCPGPLTAVCDITEQPAYTTYAEFTLAGGTASDNCGIDETTFQLVSETSTAGNCPKVYTRTYSIEDLC